MLLVSSWILACAVCGAGERTLPANGNELAFAGRLRATVDARAAAFKEVQSLIIADQPLLWLVELLFPTTADRRLNFPGWGGNGVRASFDDVFLAA